ncbi:MAG: hypothetical protein HZB16_09385 [Armatimonadetes bacterium]|nr:hypothetical protein [Armatimonadota bacterium]
MRHLAACLCLTLTAVVGYADSLEQRLPPGGFRDVAWQDPYPGGWQTVDVTTRGIAPGAPDVTKPLQTLIDALTTPTILVFPAGTYHFGKIAPCSNLIIRGAGPQQTLFRPVADGTLFWWWGHGGRYEYAQLGPEYQPRQVTAEVAPGAVVVPLADTRGLAKGDLVLVEEDLEHFSYPDSKRSRGGVFVVERVEADRITLDLPLAIGLDQVAKEGKNAIVAKLNPLRNVGLEGVGITMPANGGEKTSTLFFKRVQNAYLRNVESVNPSRHHVEICYSRQVVVEGCTFIEAQDKGPGGTGYGVEFRDLSTLCKAENNTFRDLRHAMATETGANYCIFGYNLNVDRVRDLAHSPQAGPECRDEKWINSAQRNGLTSAFITADVVAHGNFPHQILLEGNVFYVGCVDHSHTVNGPHFLFRNRALGQPKLYAWWQEGCGLVIEGENDNQVLVGNTLANDSKILLMKHTFERTSQGSLIAGNVLSGQVDWGPLPAGTKLPASLYLKARPAWWPADLAWPAFGPNTPADARIPAQVRYKP